MYRSPRTPLAIVTILLLVVLSACMPLPPAAPLTPAADADVTTEPGGSGSDSPTATPLPGGEDAAAARNMRQLFAAVLGLNPDQIEVVAAEPTDWPDRCLGVPDPAELCGAAITPGYKLTFRANGQTYVFHTDPQAYRYRVAEAPVPVTGQTVIQWTGQSDEGECREAIIGADGLAFGRCQGRLLPGRFIVPERKAELAAFAGQYAPFVGDTPSGAITFTGTGTATATPAEQRMLAEWAKLIQWQAQTGQAATGGPEGPALGDALMFGREDGLTGSCDSLTIDVTGTAYATTCRFEVDEVHTTRLDAAQLEQLYGWLDTFQYFEEAVADAPAAADGITTTLRFHGTGPKEAASADRQAIMDFAARVFDKAVPPAGAADALALCPEVSPGSQRLLNLKHGYCLTYPEEYKVEKPNPNETILLIGGLLDVEDPRVHIVVEDATGRTPESVVAKLQAQNQDFELVQSETTVGGEPAIVLDRLPGQEINRRVFFTHEGKLYSLMFMPADASLGELFARMETLYKAVLDSLTFLPAGADVSGTDRAAALAGCLSPSASTQLLSDSARGFCILYPADYSMAEPNPGEVVFYSGSLMDVSRPKLFVQVEDAADRTAQQIADALVADVHKTMPDYQVDRPFGVTIGYEAAERLDNMPGQDISRQVIAVHGGRAYRLTFVPADQSQAGLHRQMEELYTLALRSFRFLE